EGLLGSDRRAVEAEHKYLSGWIALGPDYPVVKPGQGDLACGRRRDDRLDCGVVLRSGIDQLLHAGQQLLGAQLLDVACRPVADNPAIAGMRVVTPTTLTGQRSPTDHPPKSLRTLPHQPRHPGTGVLVIRVPVDRRQPNVVIPDHVL